ncbi:Fms-interacting protein-domain-containing protein [Epithele typhae]|uniref:Fms-interacting protein-domain-containing protein n=1 Tax=Epithele typhae TaxID=378194 RepID=UPI00200899BC|nr:Fms-interacting protein-domain-containing protein [Epithele typhae]KAH9943404.1 Fms-interacting protein-domain-containing protein [Epithele typhae]
MACSPTHDAACLPPSPDGELAALRALVDAPAAPLTAAADPAAVAVRAGALFARLKALNRAANAAARTHKHATADARHEMDQTALGLQNLLYERRHLEREIEKCRQFASVYQDITVNSLQEFMQLAPEAARTEKVLADEHQLMLNRLSFELSERQRLDLKRKELLKEKETLLKESKTKLVTMEGVKNHIDHLMKTASDVQKKVNDLVQTTPATTEPTPAVSTPGPS